MATFNPGRNIGRLSIRVVPDTTRFREDLRKTLNRLEKTVRMNVTVRVDRATVDRDRLAASIQRQVNQIKDTAFDAQVTVTKAKLAKTKLRKSIQAEFDRLGDIRVQIDALIKDSKKFEHDVKEMVRRASRNQVNIPVNVQAAAASAQLRYVSRSRFVDVFVRVNKKSLTTALTALAALSGARLAWKWMDNLIDFVKELDRNLPAILGITSGVTSLFAGLVSGIGGLVGLGQGLVAILPAFLTLPGLVLNGAASIVALAIAMKDAKQQFEPLAQDMTDLGQLISDTFWKQARDPIIDLTTGLLPQLRNAFENVSDGIGFFTGQLARAFAGELGDGRLESIFENIAKSWRILGRGADGFAGAIVSLSQIAAQYMPRLSTWFVRQADTFDNWLNAISTDGRLDSWMEGAIRSMYDVWDVATGLTGIFKGLWGAAEAGGSEGLHGFAGMVQEWNRVVNSPEFQSGLSAIMRGSKVAMEAFGGAIGALGTLFGGPNSRVWERFIGGVGGSLGKFVDDVITALSSPRVMGGLLEFTSGLERAVDGIRPSLQPIADALGSLVGAIGQFAGDMLPGAARILAAVAPILTSLTELVGPVVKPLADALARFAEKVAPVVTDFLGKLDLEQLGKSLADLVDGLADFAAPILTTALDNLAKVMEIAIPLLAAAAEAIGRMLSANANGYTANDVSDLKSYDTWWESITQGLGEFMRMFDELGGLFNMIEFFQDPGKWMQDAMDGAHGVLWKEITNWAVDVGKGLGDITRTVSDWWNEVVSAPGLWLADVKAKLDEWFQNLPGMIDSFFVDVHTWLNDHGLGLVSGFLTGIGDGAVGVWEWFQNLPNTIRSFLANPGDWLYQTGVDLLDGLVQGIVDTVQRVVDAVRNAVQSALNVASSLVGGWSGGQDLSRQSGRVTAQGAAGVEQVTGGGGGGGGGIKPTAFGAGFTQINNFTESDPYAAAQVAGYAAKAALRG